MPASRIDRDARALDDQAQVVRVADAHAAADRRAERHDRRAAGRLEPLREHRVVARVGEDGEAVGHERLGGLEQLGGIGQQRPVVADHLELHPVRAERLAREPRGGDGVARGEAAGRVRAGRTAPRRAARRGPIPRADGSIRRIATVAISAPDSATARLSTSRLRKPPVPRIRRERSSRPAIVSGSATLHRLQDLDLLAVGERAGRSSRRAGRPRRPRPPRCRRATRARRSRPPRRRPWRRRRARAARRSGRSSSAGPRRREAIGRERRRRLGAVVEQLGDHLGPSAARAARRCGSGPSPRRARLPDRVPTTGRLSGVPGRSPARTPSTRARPRRAAPRARPRAGGRRRRRSWSRRSRAPRPSRRARRGRPRARAGSSAACARRGRARAPGRSRAAWRSGP